MEVFREAVKNNIFDVKDADAFVIPLSGFLKRDYTAVMGIGASAYALGKWPGVSREIGSIIRQLETEASNRAIETLDDEQERHEARKVAVSGAYLLNTPNQIDLEYEPYVFCYFIQPNGHITPKGMYGRSEPSFKTEANLDLIRAGALDLVRAADELNLNNIVIPRPGCEVAARDVHYIKIRDIFLEILDRRFLIAASRGSHSRVACLTMEQLQARKIDIQGKDDSPIIDDDERLTQAAKFVQDDDLPF